LDLLVEQEKIALNRPDINLTWLESEILLGDKSNILYNAKLSLEKEEGTFAHLDAGESSKPLQHDLVVDQTQETQSTFSTTILKYDPDRAQLEIPPNHYHILEIGSKGISAQ